MLIPRPNTADLPRKEAMLAFDEALQIGIDKGIAEIEKAAVFRVMLI